MTIQIEAAEQYFPGNCLLYSLRTKLTFRDANTGFPAGNDVCGTSTEMTCHYPNLGSASDLVKQIFNQSGALPRSG